MRYKLRLFLFLKSTALCNIYICLKHIFVLIMDQSSSPGFYFGNREFSTFPYILIQVLLSMILPMYSVKSYEFILLLYILYEFMLSQILTSFGVLLSSIISFDSKV